MKKVSKRLTGLLLILCFVLSQASLFTVFTVSAAIPPGWSTTKPSGSSVNVWGTPDNAIKSGPVYGSQVYFQVSPTANTNNRPYTIPSVNTLFELEDGWTIDYVSTTSGGLRQPGNSILLASSGAGLVYYFKRTAPVTQSLVVQTALNGSVVHTANRGAFSPNQNISIAPNTSSFDFDNNEYVFVGWIRVSGSGNFGNANLPNTTYITGTSATVLQVNYIKVSKLTI